MTEPKSRMLALFRKGTAVPARGAKTASGFDLLGTKTQALTLPPPVAALPEPAALPARAVFGFDGTASREKTWTAAKQTTDSLLSAIPGELEVALAVHGGGRLHTYTPFTANPARLRDLAARVKCQAGETRLNDIMLRVLEEPRVSVVIYIGDMFEESEEHAQRIAKMLKQQNTRLIILHDRGTVHDVEIEYAASVFKKLAALTGGAVLPFDIAALARLRETLAAIAVLAVGGTSMLVAKAATTPAARLLLEHLKDKT